MLAYSMRRTTVKISDELDARLRHEAARQGVTISELTRAALQSYLGARPLAVGARRELLSAGAADSGRSDISERIEEILYGEIG